VFLTGIYLGSNPQVVKSTVLRVVATFAIVRCCAISTATNAAMEASIVAGLAGKVDIGAVTRSINWPYANTGTKARGNYHSKSSSPARS
jgi:hypothetical protein